MQGCGREAHRSCGSVSSVHFTPVGEAVPELADWIETSLFAEGRTGASRAELTRRVASTFGMDENDDDLIAQIELALREIDDRRRRAGAAYPFAYGRKRVERVDSGALVPYFFMLLASRPTEERPKHRSQDAALLLDVVAGEALQSYLGEGSRSIRFGMPPTAPRPNAFNNALPWLAKEMAVEMRVPRSFLPEQYQDAGADVVAWKHVGAAMDGFLVILAQCTISANWHLKRRDAILERWSGWLNTLWPTTAMAVPFVIRSDSSEWEYIRGTVGILLDRLTMASLLEAEPVSVEGELRAWLDNEVERA
jgi:hypothetical protein